VAILGRQLGYRVSVCLWPQPITDHVVATLAATVAHGAQVHPCPSPLGALRLARRLGKDHAAAKVATPAPTPASACGCPSATVQSFAPPQPGHGHGHGHGHGGGCPSAALRNFAPVSAAASADVAGDRPSELRQWPVQMHLVPPTAPFLNGADLLLAADCAPFAYADFHRDLLKGKALLIGCPKLDDGQAYLEKLTAMLRLNEIKSLTVAHMEVPCCSGLIQIAKQAIANSGKEVPLTTIRIGIQGDLK
jgi:hypothetical protein